MYLIVTCLHCPFRARSPRQPPPLPDVVGEVRNLAGEGFREVTLTGANLGCYDDGRHLLVDLLRAVEAVPGIARLRISSIELSTTERAVVDHMAASEKLCSFLHIPVQTGDDALLRRMGRRYTRREYLSCVEYAVSRVPRLGLGTDVLVGLPGEDEAAFKNTVQLIDELPLSNLHVFPYSPRPGTRAASMPDQVPVAVRRERAARLIALGERKRAVFAQQFVGQTVTVLVERLPSPDVGAGWTAERLEARVRKPGVRVNELVSFRPVAAEGGALLDAQQT